MSFPHTDIEAAYDEATHSWLDERYDDDRPSLDDVVSDHVAAFDLPADWPTVEVSPTDDVPF